MKVLINVHRISTALAERLRFVLTVFLICAGLNFITTSAQAYAIISAVFTPYYPSYLVSNMMSSQQIRFGIQIQDQTKFPLWSMKDQVITALETWMQPFAQFGIPIPKIIFVDASDPHIDLLVTLRPGDPKFPAQTSVKQVGDNQFSEITINTEYRYSNAGKNYSVEDFSKFLKGDGTFSQRLEMLRRQKFVSIEDFAKKTGFDYMRLWMSTYGGLFHEVGHAFGLADTYEPYMESESKPGDRSQNPQPDSVMKTADFFTLTKDDLYGLRVLIKRTYNKIASAEVRAKCEAELAKL